MGRFFKKLKVAEEGSYEDLTHSWSEEGGYEGYVSGPDNWMNWLEERGGSEKAGLFQGRKVAVLKNIWVNDAYRGKGNGNGLLEEFIDKASDSGAEYILLEVDDASSGDVDLHQWYEGYGFKSLGVGSLMYSYLG